MTPTAGSRGAWTRSGTRSRVLLMAAACGVAVTAWLLPPAWYDTLPRQLDLPPAPINGVNLLRALLACQAVVLALAALFDWRFVRLANAPRFIGDRDWTEVDDITTRQARVALALVTVLACALRVYRADADLWLDEVTPILDYAALSVPQVIGTYYRSNNHLLNTILLKGMIALFGEHEWSVRLPAILFGVAGVPMLYWCARLVLSRRASLGAALLLAVSYHHIFFSQNARGYSAYLCLALLSTRALIDGLRDDRLRSWLLFIGATVLGFASLLNTAFVLAAQGLVALGVAWTVARHGGAAMALLRRTLTVFSIAAFLSAQLYAIALPEVYVVISNVYRTQSTGFVFFSAEFATEVVRGITDGFGMGALVAAVPFLLVAGAGFIALVRRSWALAFALMLPGALTATFLLVRGLTFSPRFFLLWLPLAVITAVVALDAALKWMTRSSRTQTRARATMLVAGTVAVLALLSAASLKRYYTIPKQPYRAALAYVEQRRRPEDLVLLVYLAELGSQYYVERMHLPLSQYRPVRTMPALDSLFANRGTAHTWLVVTFERALRMDLPELDARLRAGWVEQTKFAGTVGDGGIGVWAERDQVTKATPNALRHMLGATATNLSDWRREGLGTTFAK